MGCEEMRYDRKCSKLKKLEDKLLLSLIFFLRCRYKESASCNIIIEI